jgi:hypothetical protein
MLSREAVERRKNVKSIAGTDRTKPIHNTSNKLLYCDMRKARREAAKQLYEIAEGQQGFFTTKQAKAAGFAENTHP